MSLARGTFYICKVILKEIMMRKWEGNVAFPKFFSTAERKFQEKSLTMDKTKRVNLQAVGIINLTSFILASILWL